MKKINAAIFDERSDKILFFVDDYYYRCVFFIQHDWKQIWIADKDLI